jgi:CheY-like chemotaxis protein
VNKFIVSFLERTGARAYPIKAVKKLVKAKLRILLVEDNNADAELIAHELETSGLDFHLERIDSEAALRQEMETDRPDLIISDHGLPAFDGFKALEIVRHTNPDLPFIFVSGSNDQGMVVRMYDEGATDYVFKKDITDLSPAVRAALESPPTPPVQELPSPEPQTDAVAFARVRLCPSCLRAHDEQGAPVEFLDYFRSHHELVVLHELCTACQPVSRLSEGVNSGAP